MWIVYLHPKQFPSITAWWWAWLNETQPLNERERDPPWSFALSCNDWCWSSLQCVGYDQCNRAPSLSSETARPPKERQMSPVLINKKTLSLSLSLCAGHHGVKRLLSAALGQCRSFSVTCVVVHFHCLSHSLRIIQVGHTFQGIRKWWDF